MRGSRGAIVATVAASLLWGSSFSVIKIGLRSVDPYWFVFLRFAFASVVALSVVAALGKLAEVRSLLARPLVICCCRCSPG